MSGHEIWLVRHGATEWSASGRHTGTTDLPLTAAGVREAAALAPVLDRHRFARVRSSPRRRARDTARLAGFVDRIEVDPDLAEWDYGEYEGLTTDEIRRQDPGWTIWADRVPGGERAAAVEARVRRVLAVSDATDGDTLIFAHGHLLRVLTAVALGFGPADGVRFALGTATINVLGWERDQRTLRRWNVAATSR